MERLKQEREKTSYNTISSYNNNLYQSIINDANKLNNDCFSNKKSVMEFLKSYDLQVGEFEFITLKQAGAGEFKTSIVVVMENFNSYSIWY